MVNIGNDWDGILASEFSSPYYLELREFLKEEYRTHRVYPGMYDIFNARKTFLSDGGGSTPGRTEKQSPCACPGPW